VARRQQQQIAAEKQHQHQLREQMVEQQLIKEEIERQSEINIQEEKQHRALEQQQGQRQAEAQRYALDQSKQPPSLSARLELDRQLGYATAVEEAARQNLSTASPAASAHTTESPPMRTEPQDDLHKAQALHPLMTPPATEHGKPWKLSGGSRFTQQAEAELALLRQESEARAARAKAELHVLQREHAEIAAGYEREHNTHRPHTTGFVTPPDTRSPVKTFSPPSPEELGRMSQKSKELLIADMEAERARLLAALHPPPHGADSCADSSSVALPASASPMPLEPTASTPAPQERRAISLALNRASMMDASSAQTAPQTARTYEQRPASTALLRSSPPVPPQIPRLSQVPSGYTRIPRPTQIPRPSTARSHRPDARADQGWFDHNQVDGLRSQLKISPEAQARAADRVSQGNADSRLNKLRDLLSSID